MYKGQEYSNFINLHKDKVFIVCGCGVSLIQIIPYVDKFITIGVNDISRAFKPNYLVLVNHKRTFINNERWQYIENYKGLIFTQYNNKELELEESNLIKINLKKLSKIDDFENVGHSNNSPYVACHIAAQMGAKVIGLIGVDFTDNHFFENTGTHILKNSLSKIINDYDFLINECKRMNIQFYNLSKFSLISSIEKIEIEHFVNLYDN